MECYVKMHAFFNKSISRNITLGSSSFVNTCLVDWNQKKDFVETYSMLYVRNEFSSIRENVVLQITYFV